MNLGGDPTNGSTRSILPPPLSVIALGRDLWVNDKRLSRELPRLDGSYMRTPGMTWNVEGVLEERLSGLIRMRGMNWVCCKAR
jgi:hypothetical protein